jgi:single-stranded-DNA-specific exonuclease
MSSWISGLSAQGGNGLAVRSFKIWQTRPDVPDQGSLLDRLLAGRGFRDAKQAAAFLNPELNQLHDPMRMPDMAAACAAIAAALRNRQTIAVHGDYDVDGITATALVVRFLRSLGANPKILIPDRQAEGYGLSENAVDNLKACGCRLLITVDCGITSVSEISQLTAAGISVIVTDHHECGEKLPEATAVINPRRQDSQYPFASLAGVGVALKLVQALCQTLGCGDRWLDYLDLAALGTVADVVPLIDENRCLVAMGLDQLNRAARTASAVPGTPPNIGLAMLIESVNQPDRPVTAQLLGFSAAPRINAAGRMSDADEAVKLLLTEDIAEARQLAQKLIDLNRQRQEIENAITLEAMADIDNRQDLDQQNILIVARQDWHSGVIGIVASRLAEHYSRPVIVLAGDGDWYRGSCRSWGEIDILAALKAADRTLDRYGGHRKAAGLTLATGQLPDFTREIARYAAQQIHEDQLRSDLVADLVVTGEELTLDNAQKIRQLEPFGEANPVPLLICRDLSIADAKLVGNGKHLKIRLTDEKTGRSWDSIAFGFGDADEWTGAGDLVDVLFSLEINEWQGIRQVQLNIRDMHPAECGSPFIDRPWEAERLYQAHGSINKLMQQLALPVQALLPCSHEYKTVYQYLRTNYGTEPVLIDMNLLARKIGRNYQLDLHPFRLARILAVFHETGLIQRQDMGRGRLRLTLLPVTEKVRLDESPTYRRLSAECEGGGQS